MEASHPAVTSDARSIRVPMAEHRVASFGFERATAKQATFQVAPWRVRSLCLSEQQFPTPLPKMTPKDLADLGAGIQAHSS